MRRLSAGGALVITLVGMTGLPATAGGHANYAGMSTDGSRVLFYTQESLVTEDTDGYHDLYLHASSRTALASVGPTGGFGPYGVFSGNLTPDGSHVLFHTDEPLVSLDTDAEPDVYVNSDGVTELVSVDENGLNGSRPARAYAGESIGGIYANASHLFFGTDDKLVASDTDAELDVYERAGTETNLISRGEINGNESRDAGLIRASSDGSTVGFLTSEALVSGDTDNAPDLYLRADGKTTLLSTGDDGGGNDSRAPWPWWIAGDGSKVIFTTGASLTTNDTDSAWDVYQWTEDNTTLISVGPDGGNAETDAFFSAASADGTRVFFRTAESLVAGDEDAQGDGYESDGTTTKLVTEGEINGDEPLHSTLGTVSSDGSKAFFTTAEQLVPSDTDSSEDSYKRQGETTTLMTQGEINGNGPYNAGISPRGVSVDGSRVFFGTNEQLVTADTDASRDVYERHDGETTLVSTGQINGNGPFGLFFHGVSSDGAVAVFETDEQLVADDTDGTIDLYAHSGGVTRWVSGPDMPPADDTDPPQTTIAKQPKDRTKKARAGFRFSSDESGSSFECRLDRRAFQSCESPKKYRRLKPGAHRFRVRSTDPSGNVDSTAAKFRWRVLD